MKHKHFIAAILLAGGRGERMGRVFKQFLPICGKPMLVYSLKILLKFPIFSSIVIVLPKEKMNYARRLIGSKIKDSRIEFIVGGRTRRKSTYNALTHLRKKFRHIDFVVLHDAVRPLVTKEMVDSVIKSAFQHSAAVTGVKAIDTVASIKNSSLVSVLSRKNLYYTYLPHCYKFQWLWDAHISRLNSKTSLREAENMELLTRLGRKIKIVPCYPNFKVTYPGDEKIVAGFLSNVI